MQFDVITLFPSIIENYCNSSIIGRAQNQGIINVSTINPRDFSTDKHKKVDDTPYGGGAGMVLACQPYMDAISSINMQKNSVRIMLTPQGRPFTQQLSVELSQKEQIVLICGHYEGFDERIRESADVMEISIGDFVLTGGELPALCLLDSISRNIEGALGKIESAHYDTFSDGLLEYPHYTRPYDYNGMKVPDVLTSGNHGEIEKWRRQQQLIRTYQKRPDLLEKITLSKSDKAFLDEYCGNLGTKK